MCTSMSYMSQGNTYGITSEVFEMSIKTPRPRPYDVEKWDSSALWCATCGKGKKSCKCKPANRPREKRSKKK